jgi:hypothetical protein
MAALVGCECAMDKKREDNGRFEPSSMISEETIGQVVRILIVVVLVLLGIAIASPYLHS